MFEYPDTGNKSGWMNKLMKEDEGLFSKDNRPAVVQDLYQKCRPMPNLALIQVLQGILTQVNHFDLR